MEKLEAIEKLKARCKKEGVKYITTFSVGKSTYLVFLEPASKNVAEETLERLFCVRLSNSNASHFGNNLFHASDWKYKSVNMRAFLKKEDIFWWKHPQ